MEAATPLRHPHVKVIGDVLAIDGLVVEDGCAVRLVREREQNGEDPVKTVLDAVSIGARVLDREQAAANAEFVKTEFERAAGELNVQFSDRARQVAEYFNERVGAGVRSGERAPPEGAREAASRTAARSRCRTASASSSRRRSRARARTS